MTTLDSQKPMFNREHIEQILTLIPWAIHLGFKVTDVEMGRVSAILPWKPEWEGEPESGIIDGGVMTGLLDNIGASAVGSALTSFMTMSTLDMRVDYITLPDKERDILAMAHCYKMTRSVAFVHAWAFHETKDTPIATAAMTYALNDPTRWAPDKGMKKLKSVANDAAQT